MGELQLMLALHGARRRASIVVVIVVELVDDGEIGASHLGTDDVRISRVEIDDV